LLLIKRRKAIKEKISTTFSFSEVIFLWSSRFKYRQIIKRLKALGFVFDRQASGSHEIWYSQQANRYTTIANHAGDMLEGILRAILRKAGINPKEFLRKK